MELIAGRGRLHRVFAAAVVPSAARGGADGHRGWGHLAGQERIAAPDTDSEGQLYGPTFLDEATGRLIEVDVTDTHDEYLMLDTEGDTVWRGHIVHPGETFSASVGGNTEFRIRYRRAGWSGVLERRKLVIFGGL